MAKRSYEKKKNKMRGYSVAAAIATAVSMMPAAGFADETVENTDTKEEIVQEENINEDEKTQEAEATDSEEQTKEEEVNGNAVLAIKQEALKKNTDITKVVMPDSVTTGEPFKFAMLKNTGDYTDAADFEFDESTGTITKYIGTATEVNVPDEINGKAVVAIGSCAFYHDMNITKVVIPDSVESIKNMAFSNCEKLESIKMPKVTMIENYAFWDCRELTSIELPEVTTIENSAFYNSALKSKNISSK